MARRVGIELSPFRCVIVDVEVPRGRSRQTARIRTFRTIPWSTENTEAFVATLRLLRASKILPNRAVVALWGVRSANHVTTLAPGKDADLRALALSEAQKRVPLLDETETASTVLFDDSASRMPGAKRDATVVVASAVDVRSRLAPLVAAGFTVEAAVTMPVALASLSRLLHRHSGNTVQAYLAVNADATAIGIVRNGLLVFAREVPLGFKASVSRWGAPQRAESSIDMDFANRLGEELKRSFLFFKQQTMLEVERVYICGEFPALRTLTAPLMHALDLQVETLDSMDGLSPVTNRSDIDLRYRAGELRIAWAVATDRRSTANLLPIEVASRREVIQFARRSVAGIAAGCLLVAGSYLLARAWENGLEARSARLQREIGLLEPRIQEAERSRSERETDLVRASALGSFAVHGPRLARILEVLGRSTPHGVVLESLSLVSNDDVWRLSMKGKASGSTPADAQTAFNQFLRFASASPLLGQPVEGPSISVSSADRVRAAGDKDKGASARFSSAQLDFSVVYEVRR
jgi:Tfp pilus assembly PilM family ATPase/Tfp pilus assembly protein PilN